MNDKANLEPADTSQEINESNSLLRKIFLNLFINLFLISSYFFFSVNFGSISTIFINNPEFLIQFGVTLFIFTLFSIGAGSIHGFTAGFIGEYLYQLAFYNAIYFNWMLIIGIFGAICGMYKYKPLKYHEGLKVYYTFINLMIASFIAMLLIIIFYFTFNNNLNLEDIILNYGLKFLIQSIISILFFIPILLIVYDKILAGKERHIYHEILTHHPLSAKDHTFRLTFGRTHVYFCTRCSGFVIGVLFSMFITTLLFLIFDFEISAEMAILFCIILPIPGLIDWGTQRMLLRTSTTESRLLTGFIIGLALHFISYTQKYVLFLFFLIILYFSIFFILMYFGNKKEMKRLEEEYDDLSPKADLEDDNPKDEFI